MKKKYKLLFLIIILLFIGIVSIFFFKKNKAYVDTVESSSKKYLISYESGYKKTNTCNRYYDGFGTKVYKMNEVSEGYPMYLIDGCAVSLSWYLSNTSDSVAACTAQKEYAQKNIASSSNVEFYNSSCGSLTGELEVKYDGMTCSDAKKLIEEKYIDYLGLYNNWFKSNCSGTSINIDTNKTYYFSSSCESLRFNNKKTGILKYNDSKNTCGYDLFYVDGSAVELDYYIAKGGDKNEYCSYMKGKLQANYTGNSLAINDYNEYCSPKTDTSEFKNGVTKITERDDCANNINIYNNVLAPTIALKKGEYTAGNACNYTVYYYKGEPYTFDAIFEKDDVTIEEKTNLCIARYEQINGTNSNDYDTFNKYCSSVIGKNLNYEETIDVVFQANDGYGLECRNLTTDNYTASTTANNECTYRFKESLKGQTISLNYSELPDSSSLVQLTTGAKFNGWRPSNSTECSSMSGGLTLTLPDGETAERITYSPCYSLEEKKSLGYTLYQKCDGVYNGDSENGQTNVDNSAILKSSVISTKLYATTSMTSEAVDNSSFKLNNFCTISCTESVNYNYPTIFETVKSGTYFELLSYPKVKSNLTCTENFSYDNWRAVYDSQIKKEKIAYVNKKNSYNINNLSFSKTSNVCSSECTSSCTYGGCCSYKYYYTYSATTSIYSYDSSNGIVSSSSKDFSYCERYSSADTTKVSAKATYGVNSGNATYYSGLYDTAKGQRKSLESANEVCVNAMKKSNVSTDNFYKTTPNLYFYYESDVDKNENSLNGDTAKYHKDTLKASNAYMKDTGVHDWNVDTFYEEEAPITISYDDVNDTFNSIKTKGSFLRTVTRNYVYNKSDSHDEYYAKNQSGEITSSGSNSIYLGYVYPVSLTLSGSRKVYFSLDFNTNLSWGAKEVLGTEGTSVSDKNVYQCSYDISNDIIVEDTTSVKKDDYKKNFYIRSISTQDVDPNDRFGNGLLGANWATTKGQTLIEEIEKRAENKNTYNPKYLEYSFTLNATTIEAVKAYNATTKYDDFDLSCNNFGGECTSEFLEALSKSKLEGKSLTGVNAYLKRKSDPTWKYYIGDKWYILKSITDYKNYSSDCSSYIGNKKNYYECLYRNVNEGVLP